MPYIDKMKKTICIVSDSWAPQLSGVVNTLTQTISCLEEKGFAVSVIEPSQCKSFDASFISPRLRFAIPPYHMNRLEEYDAVHIATEGPLGWAAKNYCDKRKKEYSTAYHTNFPLYLKKNWRIPMSWSYGYVRKFHAKSAAVMVPTNSIIRDLEAHGFKNCVLWGRGVDQTIFNKGFGGQSSWVDYCMELKYPRPFFLNVGRLSKEKNLDAFLSLDLPGTKFIVGEGPDEDRLKRKFPEAVYLGKRTGSSLAAIYRLADVFVFPSHFDTFGLVNIESIACGTPVAAFPAPGPIDIIEQGVTGVCDPDLKTACLATLKIGECSGEFSWETATDQFVANLQFKKRPS